MSVLLWWVISLGLPYLAGTIITALLYIEDAQDALASPAKRRSAARRVLGAYRWPWWLLEAVVVSWRDLRATANEPDEPTEAIVKDA